MRVVLSLSLTHSLLVAHIMENGGVEEFRRWLFRGKLSGPSFLLIQIGKERKMLFRTPLFSVLFLRAISLRAIVPAMTNSNTLLLYALLYTRAKYQHPKHALETMRKCISRAASSREKSGKTGWFMALQNFIRADFSE
jgi:hypothetical protein